MSMRPMPNDWYRRMGYNMGDGDQKPRAPQGPGPIQVTGRYEGNGKFTTTKTPMPGLQPPAGGMPPFPMGTAPAGGINIAEILRRAQGGAQLKPQMPQILNGDQMAQKQAILASLMGRFGGDQPGGPKKTPMGVPFQGGGFAPPGLQIGRAMGAAGRRLGVGPMAPVPGRRPLGGQAWDPRSAASARGALGSIGKKGPI